MRDLLDATERAVREVGRRLAARQPAEPLDAATPAEARAAFAAVDRPAARELRERLGALRPGAGWLDDEWARELPADGEWWLCDATDGAVQYLSALPHWAVTATLLRDGAPVLAVVHAPREGATHTAAAGGGARLNGRPCAPRARVLATAVAATSQPPDAARDPEAVRAAGAALSAVLPHVPAVRNLGPTALQVARVGSGHLTLFWQYGADPANLLPGALLAAEAGARVTDARGEPWTPAARSFVAAAPGAHAELLGLLRAV
ncbi:MULTISPECIES: inositol monophosphatase family protein [Kitasatospora]|uniref:Putative inositol monophosphatase n=1 Tax=Kitasatospora setae (strain ATCC 33774 / DSM 43861 / JCM 3304 / KCC A-0304 / NBRC 14216 / KM-6054) TaxID=452652 RepID=E4NAN1_KITSK|nr:MULTISPECIES: inositol monophosphatase family protein [Kitasatospora]BAJ28262.1 putative inositol monophosphatase [Kitasatospora setae KM-6054]